MSFQKSIEPKDTEEVKPGIFVQKYRGAYRVVNPISWKGKWRFNKQFGWRNLATVLIIGFLAFTYFEETNFCRALEENPCEILPNITNYCLNQAFNNIELDNIFNNERGQDTFTLQDNP